MKEMKIPLLISSSRIECMVLVHVSIVYGEGGTSPTVSMTPQHLFMFFSSAKADPNNYNYRFPVEHAHCGIFAL
jgi:hypothetical protein